MKTPNSRSGFTLVELLVVLGVIGLLAGLLLPALAQARLRGQSAQAMNNLRQLGLAWLLYADDHGGRLPPNRAGADAGKSADTASWVGGWLDYRARLDNVDTSLLIDPVARPNAGFLGPYLQTAGVFRDPADRSQVQIFGKTFNRVRTVSMNLFMHGGTIWPAGNQDYRIFTRLDDLVRPSPTMTWVMMTEQPQSINDGWFAVDMTRTIEFDFPATFYNGANHIVFADGHVESHRWKWLVMPTAPANPNASWCPKAPNPDSSWLRERTSAPN